MSPTVYTCRPLARRGVTPDKLRHWLVRIHPLGHLEHVLSSPPGGRVMPWAGEHPQAAVPASAGKRLRKERCASLALAKSSRKGPDNHKQSRDSLPPYNSERPSTSGDKVPLTFISFFRPSAPTSAYRSPSGR